MSENANLGKIARHSASPLTILGKRQGSQPIEEQIDAMKLAFYDISKLDGDEDDSIFAN